MMEVIDNFLNYEIFQSIQSMFFRKDFPWFFAESVIKKNMCDDIDNFQFSHTFYENYERVSNWNISPVIQKMNINAIVKVKANLNPKTDKIIKHGYHTDHDLKCKTSIYYINTNNGFTEFEDGTKVESIENRLLLFDSNLVHTGTTCTDKQRRIVLNFNYY